MSDFDKQAGVRVPLQRSIWQSKLCHEFLTARQGQHVAPYVRLAEWCSLVTGTASWRHTVHSEDHAAAGASLLRT